MPQSLTQLQIASVVGTSTFLWGVGAATIRYVGPYLYSTEKKRLATAAATVPMSYVLVRATESLFVKEPSQKFAVFAIATGVPLILDGLAFSFYPQLYENEDVKKKDANLAVSLSRTGASWLLYGVGCCLLFAAFT